MSGKQVLAISLLLAVVLSSTPFTVIAQDTDPPEIANVQVAEVTEDSVTITWETDEEADSLINYGLQENYGIVRVPVADREQHSITLDNLEPGRTYYFRVVSADENGNQGISADYSIVTLGESSDQDGQGEQAADGAGAGQAADVTGEGQEAGNADVTTVTPSGNPSPPQQIIEQIQEIQDPETLQEILNETVKAIEGVTEDLTIVGPPTVVTETNAATISWTTDRPADSRVFFSRTDEYIQGQYQFEQASTQGLTQDHEIRIIGLEPFTEYTFKVESTDEYEITGASRDYTFITKASRPEIRNLRILKVQENSATIAWDTTVPAKALVEYQDLTTGEQNSKGRPTFTSNHQMQIDGLTLGTRYVAFVIAENAGGDRIRSNPLTFVTVKDTAPPIISNVTNESTLFPGDEQRIQTIIEWNTDEPAYCTVTYQEGVAGGVEPITIESEEINYTEEHVEVIVDFASATVYQFYLTCADEAGNSVESENFVLFTPIQEKNIIDIIIENFEASFGWVRNIGG